MPKISLTELRWGVGRALFFSGFPGGSVGKASAYNVGDPGLSLDREDPLEKKMATHFSTLAWRIPWRRSLVGYSPWGCKELDTTEHDGWMDGSNLWLKLLCVGHGEGVFLHLLPALCLTTSHLQLETGHNGNVYTLRISKFCTLWLLFFYFPASRLFKYIY